jgi:signal transduction histidine kinase
MGWALTGRRAWLLVVAVLVATGQLQAWWTPSGGPGGRVVEALLVALATVPLLFRLPALVLVLATMAGGVGLYVVDSALGQPWFALLLALYALGRRTGTRASLAGLGLVAAFVLATDLPRLQEGAQVEDVLPAWFILGGVFGFGRWMRSRAAEREELLLSTEAAADHERARIARELHDLVGHSLAVIVLQAQAAGRVLPTDPERALGVLETIERLGRDGLGELRRLLGMLVSDDDPTPAVPSMDHLDDLVGRFADAGLPVELAVHGEARRLPSGLDLSAYRIVQEALTNTLKHAGPTRASVDVAYTDGELEIRVADEGQGPSRQGSGRVGHGLIGMHQRVALYGGQLLADARPGGGFEVVARFPLGTAA